MVVGFLSFVDTYYIYDNGSVGLVLVRSGYDSINGKEKMIENVLFMMSGLPGCGKSTFIERTLQMPCAFAGGLMIISRDGIIEYIAETFDMTYNDIFNLAPRLIDKLFQDHIDMVNVSTPQSIIWDQTNLSKKVRAQHLAKITIPMTKVLIQFEAVPMDYVRDRLNRPGKTIPEDVYSGMLSRYEVGTLDEGFDEVWRVSTMTGAVVAGKMTAGTIYNDLFGIKTNECA